MTWRAGEFANRPDGYTGEDWIGESETKDSGELVDEWSCAEVNVESSWSESRRSRRSGLSGWCREVVAD